MREAPTVPSTRWACSATRPRNYASIPGLAMGRDNAAWSLHPQIPSSVFPHSLGRYDPFAPCTPCSARLAHVRNPTPLTRRAPRHHARSGSGSPCHINADRDHQPVVPDAGFGRSLVRRRRLTHFLRTMRRPALNAGCWSSMLPGESSKNDRHAITKEMAPCDCAASQHDAPLSMAKGCSRYKPSPRASGLSSTRER